MFAFAHTALFSTQLKSFSLNGSGKSQIKYTVFVYPVLQAMSQRASHTPIELKQPQTTLTLKGRQGKTLRKLTKKRMEETLGGAIQ